MSDGTRPGAEDSEQPDWLRLLIPQQLQGRIVQSLELGELVAGMSALWARSAGRVIAEVEAGLTGRGLDDGLFIALADRVGLTRLIDIAESLSDAGEAVALIPHVE